MELLCKYDFFDQNTKTINSGAEPKDAFVVVNSGDTIPTDYTDVSSVQYWVDYGSSLCTDYLQLRERVRGILDVIGWTGITNSEKYIIIGEYMKESSKDDTTANTEKISFLMGEGYTMSEAQGLLIKSYASHHLKEVNACLQRANSEKLYMVIAKYLTLDDAGDLIKITHKLFDLYKTQGIKGVNDGNAGEGIFDFLESSVGTSFETSGLEQQGYTLNTGDYNSFISELMDVLRNGNY